MVQDDPEIHPEAAVAPGYLANHAARVFNRLVDNALRPHGLTLALIGPLLLLSWKGPMRQRDMVAASAVKQPAMAALLDKLEAAGHVTRAVTALDRRASLVRLTEQGEGAAEIGRRVLREANALGGEGLDGSETLALTRLLQRFIDNLERTAGT